MQVCNIKNKYVKQLNKDLKKMSNNISQVFIAQFDANVKQAYQGQMKLNGKTRMRTGVVGKTYNFPVMGKGLATPRIAQADITPVNASYEQKPCILTDWNAAEYSDIFNQQKVNFNDVSELQKMLAYAVGRRADQIIIDELNNGATQTVAADFEASGTASAFSLKKLLRAKKLLDDKGVPMEDRYFVHSTTALEDALNNTTFTSADFNTIRALVQGDLKTFAGFNFVMIEDRAEGGLSLASGIRTNLCFHKDAIGLAVGMDMSTKIDWVPEKTSYLANVLYSAGAKTIDGNGIVKLNAKEV